MSLLSNVLSMFLPTDVRQNIRLRELESRANTLQRENRRQDSTAARIDQLEKQVGELLLLVQAMLQEQLRRGQLDPTELDAAMQSIDRSDGKVDGRVTVPKPPTTSRRPYRRRRPD
jgi:hypothetical protein